MKQAPQLIFDSEDYLAWEALQTEKHEYVADDVFAMAWARREHVVVSGILPRSSSACEEPPARPMFPT